MCGKITQRASWRHVVDLAHALIADPDDGVETVTPMRSAIVVALDGGGKRRAVRMRWGWPGRNAFERPGHIHARAETIDGKPAFRDAFLNRRGLLLVNTFNEGRKITPAKTEQHVITPRDGKPLAIAVIWNRWETIPPLLAFCMVTVPANALIGTITDRMLAVLQAGDWEKWLGEEPATVEELKAMLRPFKGDWTMEPALRVLCKQPPPKHTPQTDLQGSLF